MPISGETSRSAKPALNVAAPTGAPRSQTVHSPNPQKHRRGIAGISRVRIDPGPSFLPRPEAEFKSRGVFTRGIAKAGRQKKRAHVGSLVAGRSDLLAPRSGERAGVRGLLFASHRTNRRPLTPTLSPEDGARGLESPGCPQNNRHEPHSLFVSLLWTLPSSWSFHGPADAMATVSASGWPFVEEGWAFSLMGSLAAWLGEDSRRSLNHWMTL